MIYQSSTTSTSRCIYIIIRLLEYIFATQFRRPWIFQTMNSVRSNIISLKYQKFTPLGKYIGIRKLSLWQRLQEKFSICIILNTCPLLATVNKYIVLQLKTDYCRHGKVHFRINVYPWNVDFSYLFFVGTCILNIQMFRVWEIKIWLNIFRYFSKWINCKFIVCGCVSGFP